MQLISPRNYWEFNRDKILICHPERYFVFGEDMARPEYPVNASELHRDYSGVRKLLIIDLDTERWLEREKDKVLDGRWRAIQFPIRGSSTRGVSVA